MKKPKPSLNPQRIHAHAWYYENLKSIAVYADGRLASPLTNVVIVRIPKHALMKTAKRLGWVK